MATGRDFQWISAARTHVGKIRKLNEDAHLDLPGRCIWVVADGMGGHNAGDYASRSVVEVMSELPSLPWPGGVDAATAALQAVNTKLYTEGQRGRGSIIGCTLVALLSNEGNATLLWAGDSRVYRVRGNSFEQLTRDHSRVQTLIDQGSISADEAEQHPDANVVTRAVGVADKLELESRELTLHDGDTFLLCSDGLSRYLTSTQMHEALLQADCERACEMLMAAALKTPARDNITAIVARSHLEDTAVRTVVAGGREDSGDDPTVLARRPD